MKKNLLSLALSATLLLASQTYAMNPMLLQQTGQNKASTTEEAVELPENLNVREIDAIIARLDDDQVRRLLIAQLQSAALESDAAATPPSTSGLGRALQWFESRCELFVTRAYRLGGSLSAIPGDIGRGLAQLSDGRGAGRLAFMVLVVMGFLAVGYGVEKTFGRLTGTFRNRIDTMPAMDGILKSWGAVLKFIPELLGLFVFILTPLILFLLTIGSEDKGLLLLFLAFLIAVAATRLSAVLLKLIFSQETEKLRLFRMSDAVARYLSKRLLLVAGILAVGTVGLMLFERLGAALTTLVWLAMLYGSIVILIFAGMIWGNRHRVQAHLVECEVIESETSLWLRRQFAGMWHVLALTYLFVVWLLALGHLVMADEIVFRGTFIVSFLIVPIYLALDRLALWCLNSTVVATIKGQPAANDEETLAAGDGHAAEPSPAAGGYMVVVRRVVRVVVFAAVALWFLDIWGFGVPLGEAAVEVIFNILVTLLLAHIAWELISAAISRKLAQGDYGEKGQTDDADDEWGATGAQDRSHTLLPMLRKFIGIVILVMTLLIVLSSIGVDIGPLLAGAGVVGLAIGFGAQKLVRDILSGIFFLMDDAFRVGEYLASGGVSGTVEEIPLRPIKLRHHRGMLQIVPLGDLKSITNFMRGGMVVKFDLMLPYDTDIDKVRKIIKKVGKRMLLDEELGPDFIKPLKSQGVRSVGDSVMNFRAKFTARPGKHFVIRREAYKYITEALEKEGIHYAHRKVIVDLAPGLAEKMDVGVTSTARAGEDATDILTPEQRKGVVAAGAAAALDTIVEQEGKAGSDGKKGKK